MTVNFKIEDTQRNVFFASYNSCLDLGAQKISQVFNFNAEENEDVLRLIGVLKHKLGNDSIMKIQNIVQKLQENKFLTREDQLILGMAYKFYREVKLIEKNKLHAFEKEAHFSGHLPHKQIPSYSSGAQRPAPRHGKSHLQETTDSNDLS